MTITSLKRQIELERLKALNEYDTQIATLQGQAMAMLTFEQYQQLNRAANAVYRPPWKRLELWTEVVKKLEEG